MEIVLTTSGEWPAEWEWIKVRDSYGELVARVSAMEPEWPEVRRLADEWLEAFRDAPRYLKGWREEVPLDTSQTTEIAREIIAVLHRARCTT